MTQIDIFKPTPLSSTKEVAQHNNLIFAPFALGSYESKMFISMLERIDRNEPNESFPEWRIPMTEIISGKGGSAYEEIKKARHALVGYVVDIAPAHTKVKKSMPRTIVKKCDHEEGKGYIICQFHEDMKEYLLKLIGNFTRADLSVLKNFKDEKSVRFYWMLKSRFYNQITSTTITVEECRKCLLPKDSKSYTFPNDFRKHILERIIQKELEITDCAFEIGQPVKNSRQTVAWTFHLKQGSLTLLGHQPLQLSDSIISMLESCVVDAKGIRRINDSLGKEIKGVVVDETFIRYVVSTLKQAKQKKGSEIANLGGYIVDSIVKGYLCEQYLAGGRPKAAKPLYKQPVSVKRAAEDGQTPTIISMGQAEQMYAEAKAAGKTKYPFGGFVKGLKSGSNILVDGYSY